MSFDSGVDWHVKDGNIQNKNLDNGCVGLSNNLQRCYRCINPCYYDSSNLLRHNLTHLQVSLDKLPDEIFQFYEQEPPRLVYEEPDLCSDIHEHINTIHSDLKSEIGETENNTNNTKTLSKNIEDDSNIQFAINVKEKNIDTIKFKVEEHISKNTMDCFLDVEQLNKIIEHNNNDESAVKRKLEHYVNIIKYEVEENNINFDSENSIKAIEDNNLIREDTIVIKSENESNPEPFEAIENLNYNENDIESETKIRLQRFDCDIIKCEIEEIHSDNYNDSTDQLIDVENTQNDIEETSDIDIAEKIEHFSHNTVVKSEIASESEIMSNIDSDSKTDSIRKENPKKKIIIDVSKLKKSRQCHICKKFISYKHLGQHISEVHKECKVECEICSKVFKCRKTMKSHVKNVHKFLTFECDYCKNEFKSKDCLQKHIKNVHGKAVKCKLCGSRLASKMYLNSHMRRVHYDDGKVHSCDICGKIFKSPRYVRVHMKNAHRVSSKSKIGTKKKVEVGALPTCPLTC